MNNKDLIQQLQRGAELSDFERTLLMAFENQSSQERGQALRQEADCNLGTHLTSRRSADDHASKGIGFLRENLVKTKSVAG